MCLGTKYSYFALVFALWIGCFAPGISEARLLPEEITTLGLKSGGSVDIVTKSGFTPITSSMDAVTRANTHIENAIQAWEDARDNVKTLSDKRTELDDTRKPLAAREKSKEPPLTDAETTKLANLNSDIDKLDREIKKAGDNIETAMTERANGIGELGRATRCPGCGGRGGGGGELSPLETLLIAGAIGAGVGVAAAALASGKDGNSQPQQNTSELEQQKAAAAKAEQEKLAIEGQLAKLRYVTERDSAQMNAQTVGLAIAFGGNSAAGVPGGSLGISAVASSGPLTYGGLSEVDAQFGPPVRCYNSGGQSVSCSSVVTVGAYGAMASNTRPVECYDTQNHRVPCPIPRHSTN